MAVSSKYMSAGLLRKVSYASHSRPVFVKRYTDAVLKDNAMKAKRGMRFRARSKRG